MFGLAERDHMFHPRDFLQVFFSHDPRHESHAAINRKIPFSPPAPSLSRFLSLTLSHFLSLSPNYICVIARVRAPTCVCVRSAYVNFWLFFLSLFFCHSHFESWSVRSSQKHRFARFKKKSRNNIFSNLKSELIFFFALLI
jgi:hypothetical protein